MVLYEFVYIVNCPPPSQKSIKTMMKLISMWTQLLSVQLIPLCFVVTNAVHLCEHSYWLPCNLLLVLKMLHCHSCGERSTGTTWMCPKTHYYLKLSSLYAWSLTVFLKLDHIAEKGNTWSQLRGDVLVSVPCIVTLTKQCCMLPLKPIPGLHHNILCFEEALDVVDETEKQAFH